MREMFERMLAAAETAFDRGDLTAALPIRFGWQPRDWSAQEVAWARVLCRSSQADENGREYAEENGYLDEDGQKKWDDPASAPAMEAWVAPLELLLDSAPVLDSEPSSDFWLSTLVNGWCAWDTDYSVITLTDRVAVLTIDGLGDLYPRFPMPSCLLDRSRLLPAVAEALDVGVDWFGTLFAEVRCSHDAAELYRVMLVTAGFAGGEIWKTGDREIRGHLAPAAQWGFDDLRAMLGEVARKEG